MGATFALTESVVANTREKEDSLNGAAGGCAAGFLAGIRGSRPHPHLTGYDGKLTRTSSPVSSRSRNRLHSTRRRGRHL
jgi:hypothetical protein